MPDESTTYELRLVLKGDKLVIRGFDDVTKNLNRADQKTRLLHKNIGSLSMLMGGVGVAGIAYGAKKLVDLASAAEETQNKFDVVFKSLGKDANEWAESFGQNVGRARQDVKAWMAGLQDTFVPLGFAREESYKLAQSLTQLAVDVASFNNAADEEVIRDFTSALVGNHETVRKYGIIISETAMAEEALARGMKKKYSQLTDLEKVQLRYNIIQKGTADAEGDALRTADSYANQVKRLNANLKDLGETFGTTLLPRFTELVTATNDWIKNNKVILDQLVEFATWGMGGTLAGISKDILDTQIELDKLKEERKKIAKEGLLSLAGGTIARRPYELEALNVIIESMEMRLLALINEQNKALDEQKKKKQEIADTDRGGGAGAGLPRREVVYGLEGGKELYGKSQREIEAGRAAGKGPDYGAMLSPIISPDEADLVDQTFEQIYKSAEGFEGKMVAIMENISCSLPEGFESAADVVERVMLEMTDATQDMFDVLISGSGNAAKAFAKSMLQGLGAAAKQQGTYWLMHGLAMLWVNPAAGAQMIASGMGLMALGSALGVAGGAAGGGGRGGGGGGYASYGESAGAAASVGARTSYIIIEGATGRTREATLTEAEKAIESSLPDPTLRRQLREALRTGGGVEFSTS